ncbi:MBL fold metallo-hydrolase [Frankia sp. QA3]|uniref:MBL fold metallo-hydrolase n=1 Tax=Frankia sp. QA3 TaxID=710111 RepID=UPI000269C199|nr:MBL fold metallo-hydrolase [Frankia sp. QA3]EIV92575.1 Zn-dependent hydrolase, glyoxylase [Frankia sp. QA3]
MLVLDFPAGSFTTNAYIIAPAPGSGCLIVDPGQRSAEKIRTLISGHRLVPEAVLLTHGHMDHTWDAVPLCRDFDIPVYIHPGDRFMLGVPEAGLPDSFPADLLEGHPHREPTDVRHLPGPESPLSIAGITVHSHHVGGHTPGSVILHCTAEDDVLLTGDALFAGSIGQAFSGNLRSLQEAVAEVFGPMPDGGSLLPGHGDSSTVRQERRRQPFLNLRR